MISERCENESQTATHSNARRDRVYVLTPRDSVGFLIPVCTFNMVLARMESRWDE